MNIGECRNAIITCSSNLQEIFENTRTPAAALSARRTAFYRCCASMSHIAAKARVAAIETASYLNKKDKECRKWDDVSCRVFGRDSIRVKIWRPACWGDRLILMCFLRQKMTGPAAGHFAVSRAI
jgi:hypothetical protein